MNYLHFSRWDPTKIDIGREYSTDIWPVSNYWVHRTKPETYDLFRQGSPLSSLPEVQIPALGQNVSLREVINRFKYASELLKEFVFEEVRREEFPEAPSRKKCMFLFDGNVEPRAYATRINFDISAYSLFEIEIQDPSVRLLRADLQLLDCNSAYYDEMVRNARKYWAGSSEMDVLAEILFEGRFTVSGVRRP